MSGRRPFRSSWLHAFLAGPVALAALASCIAAVYLAVVVGLGRLVGTGGRPNPFLSLLATAVVAVAFRPVRDRAQALANRLVYGERATPYAVLSQFSTNVAGTDATEDVLPRLARVLAEGTGAERAEVWLRVGGELRPAASWPVSDGGSPSLAALELGDGPSIEMPGAGLFVPVWHRGELLGALAVSRLSGEPLHPTEETLLSDLASQSGLLLRNVQLTAELRARVDEISHQAAELRVSRQRIVAAQDEERRRLEHDIHDGAQQHLVALAVKLRLAQTFAGRDPQRAKALLVELQTEVSEALETLRDLARGIYPPLLAEQGLFVALASQARRAPVRVEVEVEGEGVGRFPAEVEAAVYFCCLEALQNVVKYAGASSAVVALHQGEDGLEFSVTDDGVGFDPEQARSGTGLQNITDRVASLGGMLSVESSPAGTVVRGRLPVHPAQPVG